MHGLFIRQTRQPTCFVSKFLVLLGTVCRVCVVPASPAAVCPLACVVTFVRTSPKSSAQTSDEPMNDLSPSLVCLIFLSGSLFAGRTVSKSRKKKKKKKKEIPISCRSRSCTPMCLSYPMAVHPAAAPCNPGSAAPVPISSLLQLTAFSMPKTRDGCCRAARQMCHAATSSFSSRLGYDSHWSICSPSSAFTHIRIMADRPVKGLATSVLCLSLPCARKRTHSETVA
ncbi:hypothetical protein MAPG_02290 [Magnaporthiopsis poae ATCC 64411]|uniref:Secreted protein n=1 Tax=Magnaporthiopsis poae (strain ATCC 64411 / 73-15) TaxID=644358 RepID=A0A0C4DQZ1_MAGP6|nr:hypothetical protein MAPG_02290 [Magnaporthiopsis poae ATCC 64411]